MLSLPGFQSATLLENVDVSKSGGSSLHELEEHQHAVSLFLLVSRRLFELRRPLSEVLFSAMGQ